MSSYSYNHISSQKDNDYTQLFSINEVSKPTKDGHNFGQYIHQYRGANSEDLNSGLDSICYYCLFHRMIIIEFELTFHLLLITTTIFLLYFFILFRQVICTTTAIECQTLCVIFISFINH